MVKKYFLSASVLGVFVLYAIHLKTDVEEHQVVAIKQPVASPRASDEAVVSPLPTSTSTFLVTPAPTPKPKGKFVDGTYTGRVADAFYGLVQVKAVINDGKITDVIFIQYPNDRRTSIEINQQAMPLLKQEAIQVQSARVSGVSGATATSDAFVESLKSALQQAV